MRSFRKLNANPATFVVARQTHLLPSSFHSFSSDDGGGGGRGRGRGRGRGGVVTPFSPPDLSSSRRVPGMPPPNPQDHHPADSSGRGRGRGVGGSNPPYPSSTIPPPSFVSPPPRLDVSFPAGRGQGRDAALDPGSQQPKKPIFVRPAERQVSRADERAPAEDLSFHLSGAGRGKEKAPVDSPTSMGNRHARQAPGATRGRRPGGRTGRGRGAFEGEPGFAGEGGRGGRGGGMTEPRVRYASARGGRGRMSRLKPIEVSEFPPLDVGNDADGEKLTRRLGEDGAAALRKTMEEASYGALPCRLNDAYKDALNLNFRIEFEPEYTMEEFGTNPDIDEKPPMMLREALEKMKPFLVEYEGIESEQEWEEVLSNALKNSPQLKAIVDGYSGRDRMTAKKQQQELEKISKTIPESVPTSVKRFTERALLSLQSNPGWGFDKKCNFMDKLANHMNQHYK